MADKTPDIAVVRRTYNGVEGHRVKAGTRFAVGKEQGGLPVITKPRYQALVGLGLIRPFGEEDTAALVRPVRPLPRTVTTMEGTGGPTARSIRDAARRRVKQTDTPGAPKQLAGPKSKDGSRTGTAPASSSSPEAPASANVTSGSLKRRGTRGAAPAAAPASASSSSTTR
jgi:hypothetical protein